MYKTFRTIGLLFPKDSKEGEIKETCERICRLSYQTDVVIVVRQHKDDSHKVAVQCVRVSEQ